MINFYKIENGILITGSGIECPNGFKKYSVGKEPAELKNILKSKQEIQEKEYRINELKSEIQNLDLKRIRPIAEKDDEFLNVLNNQILVLRQKLRDLQNG